jgi:hypothetical protein
MPAIQIWDPVLHKESDSYGNFDLSAITYGRSLQYTRISTFRFYIDFPLVSFSPVKV